MRNAVINCAIQAWSIDIIYIKLWHGLVYLAAIIDWHSRSIVYRDLDDSLETPMVLRALDKAYKEAKPKILNSDQGSQFTSRDYMDDKSYWEDNIMIKRWFRTLKYEEVILKDDENIKEAH